MHGKDGFYSGRIARAIVDVIQEHGGLLTLDDLRDHHSTFDDPICVNYKGIFLPNSSLCLPILHNHN